MITGIKESFDAKCNDVGGFLDTHPICYKTAIAVNHLFKAITMFAVMAWSPLSAPATGVIMLASSLLYRASVERFCSKPDW